MDIYNWCGEGPTCTLCGANIPAMMEDVVGWRPGWMHEFRAVFAPDKAASEIRLSDTLMRRGTEFDVLYTSPDGETTEWRIELTRRKYPIPGDGNPDSWGFPFHCSCWELFEINSPDRHVSLRALFDLCRSLTVNIRILDFGHEYGGLYPRKNPLVNASIPLLPAEEAEMNVRRRIGSRLRAQYYDPCEVSKLEQIISDALTSRVGEPSSIASNISSAVYDTEATTRDPFNNLPVEIMQHIFLCLPLADVRNLKLSSRIAACTQISDRFWYSSFCPGWEFDDIYEVRRYSNIGGVRGLWKNLFWGVYHNRGHPFFVNRRRIWDLATILNTLIPQAVPEAGATCHGHPNYSLLEEAAPELSTDWVTAGRKLDGIYGNLYHNGCTSLYERTLGIPEKLSEISVSLVSLLTGRYISGIQVRDSDGNCYQLGYIQSHSTMVFSFACSSRYMWFDVASDEHGVRGMNIVHEGRLSGWIGDHEGIPKQQLNLRVIDGRSPVRIMKGGFDGCKMVSLAVPLRHDDSCPSVALDRRNPWHLHEKAVFLPRALLHDVALFGLRWGGGRPWSENAPFGFTMFCEHGSLHHRPLVAGIKFWVDRRPTTWKRFKALQVDLVEPSGGQTRVLLGMDESVLRTIPQIDGMEEYSFALNHADGERIVGLFVRYHLSVFIGIKIHTNTGRSAELPPGHKDLISGWHSERLMLESGHIIGLFGIVCMYGVCGLGIICDPTATLRQLGPEPGAYDHCLEI